MLKIAELRREKGKTQGQMAFELNMSIKKLAAWEQKRAEPSIEDICLMAQYFNVSTDYLLGRESETGIIEIQGGQGITPLENKLLQAFRKLDDYDKNKVVGIVQAFAV